MFKLTKKQSDILLLTIPDKHIVYQQLEGKEHGWTAIGYKSNSQQMTLLIIKIIDETLQKRIGFTEQTFSTHLMEDSNDKYTKILLDIVKISSITKLVQLPYTYMESIVTNFGSDDLENLLVEQVSINKKESIYIFKSNSFESDSIYGIMTKNYHYISYNSSTIHGFITNIRNILFNKIDIEVFFEENDFDFVDDDETITIINKGIYSGCDGEILRDDMCHFSNSEFPPFFISLIKIKNQFYIYSYCEYFNDYGNIVVAPNEDFAFTYYSLLSVKYHLLLENL